MDDTAGAATARNRNKLVFLKLEQAPTVQACPNRSIRLLAQCLHMESGLMTRNQIMAPTVLVITEYGVITCTDPQPASFIDEQTMRSAEQLPFRIAGQRDEAAIGEPENASGFNRDQQISLLI